MSVLSFLIFDDAQKAEAEALNADGIYVFPRTIDNEQANQIAGIGDLAGNLLGKSVVNAVVLSDPSYAAWRPLCSTLPIVTADSGVLFVPGEDI